MMVATESKRILTHLIERAIAQGDLYNRYQSTFEDLARETSFDDVNYFRVCCQYLQELGCLDIMTDANEQPIFVVNAKSITYLQ